MKRIIFSPAFLIGISLSLSLAGCGGPDSQKTESASEQTMSDTAEAVSDTAAIITDTATLTSPTEQAPATAEKSSPKPAEKVKAKPATSTSAISEGKALMAKSDCFACHKTDVKLVGPAYEEVAGKYPDTDENFSKLADKIVNGGAGVWGEVPMPPHPTVSSSDAKKMAQYVLSLK